MAVKQSDKAAVKWIFNRTKSQSKKLVAIITANAIYAACSTVFALVCKNIVDGAQNHNKGQILTYSAALLAVILLQLVLRLSCSSMEESVRAKTEIELRRFTLKNLLQKDYSSISSFHSGEILNRMFSDAQVVANGVTNIIPSFVNMLTRIICAVAVLIALDKSFTLIFIIAGLCLFFVTQFFRTKLKAMHKDVQAKEGRVRSFLQETVENLLVVKVFGCEEKMLRQDDIYQTDHYKVQMKRKIITIFANAGFGFIFQLGYLYAMLWGAMGIFNNTMTYGTLTAILQLVNQIQSPFANLSSLMPKFYSMTASAERLMEIQNLKDEPPSEKIIKYEDFESIKIKDLNFSYGENHVLKNVNITVNKGDFVSLTGISGGGKSTLFLLLLGAYHPQKGEILFCSHNDKFLPGGQTRPIMAYVPQGNILFSGTVMDNIKFLNDNASYEQVVWAAKTACAYDFITALPNGFNTPIGENGFGVSQGQAQRIAIARAILSGAKILLLDEATSALDEATEAELLKNIQILKDKTLLIVTHRQAALKICQRRLTLKDGEITCS